MTKNQFRLILVALLASAVLGAVVDWFWPDPLMQDVYDYIFEHESASEVVSLIGSNTLLFILAAVALVSFIGLFLFKSWARQFYVFSFFLNFFTYPFFGLTLSGGYSQILYEMSVILSGVVLALIYYSPVKKFYEHNT